MENNSSVFPLLDVLNGGLEDDREQRISHLDSKMWHNTRSGFFFMLIEVSEFYIQSPTKYSAFHAPCSIDSETSCYNGLPSARRHYRYVEPSFLAFTTEKVTKYPDEGKLIKELCLNNTGNFKQDAVNKKKAKG